MPSWQRRAHESYYYNFERKHAEFSVSLHVFTPNSLSILNCRTFDAVTLPLGSFLCQESLRVVILDSNRGAGPAGRLVSFWNSIVPRSYWRPHGRYVTWR
jgi:hypothetical protein